MECGLIVRGREGTFGSDINVLNMEGDCVFQTTLGHTVRLYLHQNKIRSEFSHTVFPIVQRIKKTKLTHTYQLVFTEEERNIFFTKFLLLF